MPWAAALGLVPTCDNRSETGPAEHLEQIMPELPRGTVTFLFTDIAGSTALWERDQVAMAAAVEHHLALLRTAVEAHDGALFKVVGDAVQAAFPTAPEAVVAALDAQRAFLTERSPKAIDRPKVLMALHTAAATP